VGANANNQWEWDGNGNEPLGMGGNGIKKSFRLISKTKWIRLTWAMGMQHERGTRVALSYAFRKDITFNPKLFLRLPCTLVFQFLGDRL